MEKGKLLLISVIIMPILQLFQMRFKICPTRLQIQALTTELTILEHFFQLSGFNSLYTVLSYCKFFCSCEFFYTIFLFLFCAFYLAYPTLVICHTLYASLSMIVHVFFFQIITTFSVVDNMKQQFYAQQGNITRFWIFFLSNFVGFLC